jgi:hypothetical protein
MNEPTTEPEVTTTPAEPEPLTRTLGEELSRSEQMRAVRQRLRTRNQRQLGRRPKSLKARELNQVVKREAEPLLDYAVRDELAARPKTRADCERCATCEAHRAQENPPVIEVLACGHRASQAVNHCRPCPWVGCRMHLYLDVKEDGHIRLNHPGKELEDLKETCTLDVVKDEEEQSREVVGDLTNLTGQRVTAIEREALVQLRVLYGVNEVEDIDPAQIAKEFRAALRKDKGADCGSCQGGCS